MKINSKLLETRLNLLEIRIEELERSLKMPNEKREPEKVKVQSNFEINETSPMDSEFAIVEPILERKFVKVLEARQEQLKNTKKVRK